jgi:hypothetical protein
MRFVPSSGVAGPLAAGDAFGSVRGRRLLPAAGDGFRPPGVAAGPLAAGDAFRSVPRCRRRPARGGRCGPFRPPVSPPARSRRARRSVPSGVAAGLLAAGDVFRPPGVAAGPLAAGEVFRPPGVAAGPLAAAMRSVPSGLAAGLLAAGDAFRSVPRCRRRPGRGAMRSVPFPAVAAGLLAASVPFRPPGIALTTRGGASGPLLASGRRPPLGHGE